MKIVYHIKSKINTFIVADDFEQRLVAYIMLTMLLVGFIAEESVKYV